MSDPTQTGKGKGKAIDVPQDVSMGEEDSSSDEETGAEDEVCPPHYQCPVLLRIIVDVIHLQSKEERKANNICPSTLPFPISGV